MITQLDSFLYTILSLFLVTEGVAYVRGSSGCAHSGKSPSRGYGNLDSTTRYSYIVVRLSCSSWNLYKTLTSSSCELLYDWLSSTKPSSWTFDQKAHLYSFVTESISYCKHWYDGEVTFECIRHCNNCWLRSCNVVDWWYCWLQRDEVFDLGSVNQTV